MTPWETTSEGKRSRSYWGFALWPLAFLVLYVLSVGPAMLGWQKGIISHGMMQVYGPLARVARVTPLGNFCEWYIYLWNSGLYDKGPSWLDVATR